MGSMKMVLHLCGNNIKRWVSNPRYYIICLLSVAWLHFLISPVLNFSKSVGVKATPFIFPHIFGEWYSSMVFVLIVVLLFCDAPFMNDSTPYECIRSGRKRWIQGQLLYVAAASFLLVLFYFAACLLLLSPNIEFKNEWGKVYNTLAQTYAGWEYGTMPMSHTMMLLYTPLQALFISSALLLLISIFVGLVIFTLNLVTSRIGGIMAGLVLAFLPPITQISINPIFYYIMPTTWGNLDLLDITGKSIYPPLAYTIIWLVTANILLIIVAQLIHRKRQIEVLLRI
ncbi:MAG: hypothetical protein FWH17_01170 [Oscillospiraceae bacterium]|nr:hypothetical protein [Oscillospiraceae bacterium]